MNPIALAQPSLLDVGLRSAVANISFGAAIVGAFGAIYTLVNWLSPAPDRRGAFLKALAAAGVPNSTLIAYTDAEDPIEMATRYLAENPDDVSGPVRQAFAATF